jgi:GSH-dependent disulfide-bond oxidoreductase
MTDTPTYTPPEVWVWEKDDGPKWRYGNINRPIAGATHEKELARGKHPLQLYSLATPNGVKVTIMLEELLTAGHGGAEYDAWLIGIGEGNQFGSGFVGVNPNSKIPALMDYSEQTPLRVFESGAILLYLADKFCAFLPKDRGKRTEALNWLFWQMGSTPYLGGGFGHFYAYAPVKIKYAIDRYSMEVKRELDVLDRQLADNQFIAGDEYIRSPIWRSGRCTAVWRRVCSTGPANSCRCRSTQMSSAGPTRSPSAPPRREGARSTAPGASPQTSCTNATTPAISKQRGRTRLEAPKLRRGHDSAPCNDKIFEMAITPLSQV